MTSKARYSMLTDLCVAKWRWTPYQIMHFLTYCAVTVAIMPYRMHKNYREMLQKVHVEWLNCVKRKIDWEWKQVVEEKVVQSWQLAQANIQEDPVDSYNCPIMREEIECTIRGMKSWSTPRPDRILPTMNLDAEDELLDLLEMLFNVCWKTGTVPQ